MSQILDFSVLLFLLNNIHAIDTISTNGTIITGENSGVTGVGVGEGVGAVVWIRVGLRDVAIVGVGDSVGVGVIADAKVLNNSVAGLDVPS